MLLRIKSVDMYGFNGRTHHPSKNDEGLLVSPIKMEAWTCSAECDYERAIESESVHGTTLTEEARHAVEYEIDEGPTSSEDVIMRVWTCVTREGRLLELMDYEVEMFRS